MNKPYPYALFSAFGVEMEYMIVDRKTLKAKAICDRLLFDFSQNYSGDFENGEIDWSNELVAHVLEIKVHRPAQLSGLSEIFFKNVQEINRALEKYDAMLLPTSAHPFFEPENETQLWPHEHNEIYALYNKVFDCKGHGWSNLQSTHLNLPFQDEKEFAILHAAIRVLLPLIPAIAASSPILEGELTGYEDSRMVHYLNNQKEVPSLMGQLIPEGVFSFEQYHQEIFAPIIKDFSPYDSEGVMEHHFLNSRGAIARFDRGAIEIRVTDIQECPSADLAIVEAVVGVLKLLCQNHVENPQKIQSIETTYVAGLFKETIADSRQVKVESEPYLHVLGITQVSSPQEIWSQLLHRIELSAEAETVVSNILLKGNLSQRITKSVKEGKSIEQVYQQLGNCLAHNRVYEA